MTQKQAILNWLKRGDPITSLEALANLKIMRLAARIEELKREGYPISSEIIETHGQKHVARYSMANQ